MTPRKKSARAMLAMCVFALSPATAAPPTAAELSRLCGNAEDQAHCGRLVEARLLPKLKSIASRDGDELRIELLPGSTTFRDAVNVIGARSYSVWDYVEDLESIVLFATNGDRSEFWWIQRRGGGEFRLPAEPVLAPGHRRFATADFCAQDCENQIAVWRIDANAVRKELTFTPTEAWEDVNVTWKGANALAIEYTPANETTPRMLERRLDDPAWSRLR